MGNVSRILEDGTQGRSVEKKFNRPGRARVLRPCTRYAKSVAHRLCNSGDFDLTHGMSNPRTARTADQGTGQGTYGRGRPPPAASVNARIRPIRRVVGPAEVAAPAVNLMTNTAITGASYDIDGGAQVVAGSKG
jgi:hypothetical protein